MACGKSVISSATGRPEACPKNKGHFGACGSQNTRAAKAKRRKFDSDLQGAIDKAFPGKKGGR